MIPILFKIGPLRVGSYGVMVAIAFLTCIWLLRKELSRKNFSPDWANNIVIVAAITGIIGSRVYFILEYFDEFLQDPFSMIFSGSGLTWYGGFILATVAVIITLRKLPAPTLVLADLTSPLLLLGYGIGRIGCFLAGDGDYGPPSDLPWAMAFPKGLVPTDVPVHPTPIYETIFSIFLFSILWRFRKRDYPAGTMLGLVFIFYGIERFVTEFWRVNPKVIGGWMSMAQILSILAILGGTIWVMYLHKSKQPH
jgi:phosphatidylglycerol---prolipoprotein diacylglyceryl transferase